MAAFIATSQNSNIEKKTTQNDNLTDDCRQSISKYYVFTAIIKCG